MSMAMFPGGGRGQRDSITFDPLFFVELLLLGLFPISLIAILQQNDTSLVAKTALIIVFGVVGLVSNLTLGAAKQQKINFIGFMGLWKNGTFVIVLMLVGLTYVSQFFISAGTGVAGSVLGITNVLQSKTYYASIGIFEELAFGVGMTLTLNNLIDSAYWTFFNSFILNPILFAIYHIYVIGASVALLYVLIPRLLFNVWYVFASQPSPVMLAHWTWNFLVAGVAASTVGLSALGFMISAPQLSLLSCLVPVGMLVANRKHLNVRLKGSGAG